MHIAITQEYFKEIAMTTNPIFPTKGLRTNRETAPAYWMIDILWYVLVDGNDTNGAYSVMEQFMRKGSGAFVPHIHSVDEWFYVFEGEMNATVGEENITEARWWLPVDSTRYGSSL